MGTEKTNNKPATEEQKSDTENFVESQIPTSVTSSEVLLTVDDFCSSRPGLEYKNRVLYVLKKKYPSQQKTFSDWNEVLKIENFI